MKNLFKRIRYRKQRKVIEEAMDEATRERFRYYSWLVRLDRAYEEKNKTNVREIMLECPKKEAVECFTQMLEKWECINKTELTEDDIIDFIDEECHHPVDFILGSYPGIDMLLDIVEWYICA